MNDDVSRETVDGTPPAPASAQGVFSRRLPLAEEFADLLTREATVRGLIGPREVPRLWERHILNCAVISDLMPRASAVCDIGSGAGLPGIALAIRRPDILVTLVEPLLRRTTFLDLAVSRMELSNVSVHRGRAEDMHGEPEWSDGFDVVTSRAVAPMDRLARWSLPLVKPGGAFLAMKGSSAQVELESAAGLISSLGGVDPEVVSLGTEWLSQPVTVVRVGKSDAGGHTGKRGSKSDDGR